MKLQRGWYVVRNRTYEETLDGLAAAERDAKEAEFFSTGRWLEIPRDRRGVNALKTALAHLLCERIQTTFPELDQKVKTKLIQSQSLLLELGHQRDTLPKKRAYLMNIAQRVSSLADQATGGDYQSISDESMKLCMLVRAASEKFAQKMKDHGHVHAFESTEEDGLSFANTLNRQENSRYARSSSKPFEATLAKEPGQYTVSSYQHISFMAIYALYSAEELRLRDYAQGYISPGSTPYSWIREEIDGNKGFELPGTLNPSIIPLLFKKQAARWKQLADEHFNNVDNIVTKVAGLILAEECAERKTRTLIAEFIKPQISLTRSHARSQIEKFFDISVNRPLQTNDRAFEARLSAKRFSRFESAVRRYIDKHGPSVLLSAESNDSFDTKETLRLPLSDLEKLFKEVRIGNIDNLQYEIHDLLQVYYELERTRFVENINKDVIGAYLYSSEDRKRPIHFFSLGQAGQLSDYEATALAEEDETLVKQRNDMNDDIARLESYMNIIEEAKLDD
jgi:Dynamin central region